MTTEPVVRVAVGTVAQAPPAPRVAPGNHAAPRRSIWLSMRSLRATGPANGGQRAPASPQRGTNGSVHGGGADHGGERAGTRTGTVGADRKTSDRGAQKTPRASAPAPHEAPADENNPRKARNASAAQIVRRIEDSEDTVLGEDPERYLELARSEGFYVAARFDGTAPTTGPNRDTLWLLNDPFSGLLLTVVGHGSAVI